MDDERKLLLFKDDGLFFKPFFTKVYSIKNIITLRKSLTQNKRKKHSTLILANCCFDEFAQNKAQQQHNLHQTQRCRHQLLHRFSAAWK